MAVWGEVQGVGRRQVPPLGASASGNPEPQLLVPFPGVIASTAFSFTAVGPARPVASGCHTLNWGCGLWRTLRGLSELVGDASFTLRSFERDRGGPRPAGGHSWGLQRDRGPVWVGVYTPTTAVSGQAPPPPAGSRSQPHTSPGFWNRCSLSPGRGVGTGRRWVRFTRPIYVPAPGWQTRRERSGPPWQEAGNRKEGGQQGGVLTPPAGSPGEASSETPNPALRSP